MEVQRQTGRGEGLHPAASMMKEVELRVTKPREEPRYANKRSGKHHPRSSGITPRWEVPPPYPLRLWRTFRNCRSADVPERPICGCSRPLPPAIPRVGSEQQPGRVPGWSSESPSTSVPPLSGGVSTAGPDASSGTRAGATSRDLILPCAVPGTNDGLTWVRPPSPVADHRAGCPRDDPHESARLSVLRVVPGGSPGGAP